jgi:asparaginyl-tRNA synthetase
MVKKEGTEEYVEIAKAAGKKLQKTLDGIRKKEAKAASTTVSSVTAKDDDKEEEIVEDKSLPVAQKIKLRQATEKRGVRVLVKGWVNNVRVQSRKLVFVDLRDGSDEELQCVLSGKLVPLSIHKYPNKFQAKSHAIQELAVETTIAIYGVINPVPTRPQSVRSGNLCFVR